MNSQELNGQKDAFQILALSGGGYKGLYTAHFIEQVEKVEQRSFACHFDLICGTSIGGIIGLALATRDISAECIVTTLKEFGPRIFKPLPKLKWWQFFDRFAEKKTGLQLKRGILHSKHANAELKNALEIIFEDRVIADLKTRVLVPAVNWTKGGPQFFKTPHNAKYFADRNRRLVDVAMATSAAPIFLPNYEFENQVYVDGGLVGNAPGLFGLHEAEHALKITKTIRLLSIGTSSKKITADQSKTLDKGIASWGSNIFELMIACQEQVTGSMLRQKLNDSYLEIDVHTGKDQDKNLSLDCSTQAATQTLLGLATQSLQDNYSTQLKIYLDHFSPALDFNSVSDSDGESLYAQSK